MRAAVPVILIVAFFVVSCTPGRGALPPTPTAPAATEAAATAVPTEKPAATAVPTVQSSEPSPTPKPTIEPTAVPTVAPTAEPTEEPTVEPTAEPTAVPTVAPVAVEDAVVAADKLNVRGGPDSRYAVVESLSKGDALQVVGQAGTCSWLSVVTPSGKEGWVIGQPQYVILNLDCGTIQEVSAPPLPTQAPTALPPTAEPSSSGGGDDMPADKGCFLFQNQLGSDLTITFTAVGRQWNDTFKLPTSEEKVYCLDPGKYTYTLDAPPPWGSANDTLDVQAGDRYRFPIRPKN